MPRELVFDIETQKSFQDVGGKQNMHLLGVSVVGVYDYENDSFRAFEEKELFNLEELLRSTGRIVGFNSKHFDVPVLQPYVKIDLKTIPHLDLMEDVERGLGFRVSLDNLARTNLGTQKSGHGMEAIQWYREGNMEAIKKYCLDDVRITRDLYEFGKKHGHVVAETRTDPHAKVSVFWQAFSVEPVQIQASLF